MEDLLGLVVGSFVGERGVGDLVGLFVGSDGDFVYCVGSIVGPNVGMFDGDFDGEFDGSVGAGVGSSVGAGVGLLVNSYPINDAVHLGPSHWKEVANAI